MVFTMHFRFRLRKPLFCLVNVFIASMCASAAMAADAGSGGTSPVLDKVDTAKMFLRGGELEAERSNWEAAVEKFQEALKLEPDSSIAHYDLGVAQFHLGQLELAAQAEKRAIGLNPKLVDAYIQLASILSKLSDFSGAESMLEEALKVDAHCQTARDSLNEICRLKRSNPSFFQKHSVEGSGNEKRDEDASDATVERSKLKHSS